MTRVNHEAAELGIDNIEHGFVLATDFNSEKKPDICPPTSEQARAAFLALTSSRTEQLVREGEVVAESKNPVCAYL
jgi:hypothetical protein